MATTKRSRNASRSRADASQAVRDSAQKIWLAGLGALERARSDGPKMFEALVEQGRAMGARAVGMADQALRTMREAEYGGRFGQRVGGSLGRLGELSAAQLDEFTRQLRELNERLRSYGAAPQAGARKAKRSPAQRRSGAKRAAKAGSRPAAKARRGASKAAGGTRRRSTGPAARRSRSKSKAGSA